MKRSASFLMMSFLALLASSCAWVPPEPAMVIAGEAIPRSELACPDRLPDSSDLCHVFERSKARRLIFDRMLDRAITTSDVQLGEDFDRQVENMTVAMGPTLERYSGLMRCHAIAALRQLGEPVELDAACVRIDQRQVDQLVANLSRREIREIVDEDLVAKMTETQRANTRAQMSFGLVSEHLRRAGRDEEAFWTGIYESLDPRFYDARHQMGPAEVITGSATGWSQQKGS